MSSEFTPLYKNSPVMNSVSFLTDFPGIRDVAWQLQTESQEALDQGKPYKPFLDVGAHSLDDFLRALNNGNEKAREIYESMRR